MPSAPPVPHIEPANYWGAALNAAGSPPPNPSVPAPDWAAIEALAGSAPLFLQSGMMGAPPAMGPPFPPPPQSRADAAYSTSLDRWRRLGDLGRMFVFGDPNGTIRIPINEDTGLPATMQDYRNIYGHLPWYAQPTHPMIEAGNDLAGLAVGVGTPFAARGTLGVAGGKPPRAKLPMDEASRTARAEEMGFFTDMPLYHGSNRSFRAFDPSKAGSMTGAPTARLGVWLARDPEIAAEFAAMAHRRTGGSPQIYPLLHRAENPAGYIQLTGREDNRAIAATLDVLWSQGYDSVMLRNFKSPAGRVGDIFVVKDPAQLRSVFARFDPAKRSSSNLLAGSAGAAIFAPYVASGGEWQWP